MHSSSNKSVLSILDFVTYVHLGCSAEERQQAQEVRFSVDIYLPNNSRAELTDSLSDAVCYANICKKINEFIQDKEFHLVESLGKRSLEFLKNQFNLEFLKISVHKVRPPIDGIQGGVKYACSS